MSDAKRRNPTNLRLHVPVPAVHSENSFNVATGEGGQQTFQFQGRGGAGDSISISQQGASGFSLSQFRLGPELG
eukprot:CAMPEP_0173103926 /NCGR_PEP_ID=MMETSP1102-20130122/38771_1 /TAXON_ID=49646 /ORGANISM="Geminigera sp., Strain Caron Lab Isolate" /LENGTH=73 /DNA_ID=CAMNT_0013999015 /DNA_START=67 /DNA_END=284 /DNA_ORIENTATION=-